jgi:hypothetical protein
MLTMLESWRADNQRSLTVNTGRGKDSRSNAPALIDILHCSLDPERNSSQVLFTMTDALRLFELSQ